MNAKSMNGDGSDEELSAEQSLSKVCKKGQRETLCLHACVLSVEGLAVALYSFPCSEELG